MAEKEYTRSMWSSELKRIALKIETIKRVAIEEANRKVNIILTGDLLEILEDF